MVVFLLMFLIPVVIFSGIVIFSELSQRLKEKTEGKLNYYESSVIRWAEDKKRRSLSSQKIGIDELLSAMILSASSTLKFGEKAKPFLGDASLFESTCYYFFETDLWLFNRRPEYRGAVTEYFHSKIEQLFSKSLKKQNIAELINDRQIQYGQVANVSKDLNTFSKELIFLLTEFIRRTKNNVIPQSFESRGFTKIENNVFEDFIRLEMMILSNVSYMLPSYYKVLENYFNILDPPENPFEKQIREYHALGIENVPDKFFDNNTRNRAEKLYQDGLSEKIEGMTLQKMRMAAELGHLDAIRYLMNKGLIAHARTSYNGKNEISFF